MFRKPNYKIVADLIHADGSFVTHTIESGINDYDVVEQKIDEINSNPPALFKTFSRFTPRWEMCFA